MNLKTVFNRQRNTAFTLAELLIALTILGVIATFTIPKVLSSSADGRYNAIAKEAAAMISGAYQVYVNERGASTNMTMLDLTSYMNYVSTFSGSIDDTQTDTFFNCGGATYTCYKLHNGAVIILRSAATFNGTTTLNALPFFIDPDGTYSNTTDGPGKSVSIFLYYNGRIADRGNIPAGTINSITSYGAAPAKTPPWFTW